MQKLGDEKFKDFSWILFNLGLTFKDFQGIKNNPICFNNFQGFSRNPMWEQ